MKKRLDVMNVFTVIFLTWATQALAATYTVNGSGGADHFTINGAISAATDNDTIEVYPGVYDENVVLKPGMKLFGSGPDQTTINGGASPSGGNPTVTMAEGSLITGFRISEGFRGIAGRDVTCVIMNNVISGNYNMGISLIADADNSKVLSLVANNTIADTLGTTGLVNTFGIYTEPQGYNTEASPIIMNNIITGNSFGISPYFATPVISYNNVWGNSIDNYGYNASPGLNDISENPIFADSDYHLAEDSPCIDMGNPAPQYVDPDGTRNDMGAYGGVAGRGPANASHQGKGFIITSIGKIPTSEITQSSLDHSHGLANVSKAAMNMFRIPAYTDSPFGGNLWLHGLFGDGDNISYYQILVGEWIDGNPPAAADYKPLNDPLGKVKYSINPDGTVTHQYVNLGPKKVANIENLYQLTTDGYWSHIDLRMIWNTSLWNNGKYTITYKAYRSTPLIPGGLVAANLAGNANDHVTIIVDNSPVTATIDHVKYDPSNPNYLVSRDGEVSECGMINLTNSAENLRFTITVNHPNGYLKNFVLDTLYGKNRYGGVIASTQYNSTSRIAPMWWGVSGTEYNSSDSVSLDPWSSCAYQFRLRAWSRTTDGFQYIIGDTFSDHYFLDLNQCAADINNDGDVDGDDLSIMTMDYGRSDCR